MHSPLRTIALKIHLYLGLTAGLVIMVLCLSAACLVFEQEITRALHPERFAVHGVGRSVPLQVVLDSARAAAPTANIGSLLVSNDSTRPWEANAGPAGRILIDPYTGHVIAVAPFRLPFFQKALEIHRWLMASDLGEQITGAATLMFVTLLLAGLILWWPRTKGAFKARINPFAVFSKHGGGRRKLHDLHVALGIWCWPLLLFMALTGLPEAYDWGSKALYFFTASPHAASPPSSSGDSTMATIPLDSLMKLGWATFPDARLWSARAGGRGNGALAVASIPGDQPSERKSDVAYFDRHTGALLRVDRWADLPIGARARRMIEPVHSGTGWGMVSKVLFFLATLFGASFPVTGFLMYRASLRATGVEG
jgi:uncharacterized iron-regulated membrane protein